MEVLCHESLCLLKAATPVTPKTILTIEFKKHPWLSSETEIIGWSNVINYSWLSIGTFHLLASVSKRSKSGPLSFIDRELLGYNSGCYGTRSSPSIECFMSNPVTCLGSWQWGNSTAAWLPEFLERNGLGVLGSYLHVISGKLDSDCLPRQPCPTPAGCPLTHPVSAFKNVSKPCFKCVWQSAGVLGAEIIFCKCSLPVTIAVE